MEEAATLQRALQIVNMPSDPQAGYALLQA